MPKRPDYGNATPEDLARALLRPVKPKGEKHAKEQGEQSPDSESSRVRFQRK